MKGKYGPKYYEVEATLSEDLKPIFRQMVDEYAFISGQITKWPWPAYSVLAEMVKGGWRSSAEACEDCLLSGDQKGI